MKEEHPSFLPAAAAEVGYGDRDKGIDAWCQIEGHSSEQDTQQRQQKSCSRCESRRCRLPFPLRFGLGKIDLVGCRRLRSLFGNRDCK